jgi:hypothetical protein
MLIHHYKNNMIVKSTFRNVIKIVTVGFENNEKE